MMLDRDSVIFEAHAGSAVVRRFFWWCGALVLLPTVAAPFITSMPIVAWAVIGCIPVVATIVMPRFAPVRVELDDRGMTFGSGLSARRVLYDDVLVVDLRKTSNDETKEAEDDDSEDPDSEEPDSEEPDSEDGPAESATPTPATDAADASDSEVAEAIKSIAEVWRVTVHAGLVPVSISLQTAEASSLAHSLHQMCPRAALWDVDGRLIDPTDEDAAASSLARVKRMATTRRVLTFVGGAISFGAFGSTFGGMFSAGIFGQVLPYFWLGLGAGLFGMAAGAEKALLARTTDDDGAAPEIHDDRR